MNTTTNFKGYWKLPASENFTHYGELTCDPASGNKLNILGSFGNQNKQTGEEVHPIVHGLSIEGKMLTLLKCEGSGNSRLPGISNVKFNIEVVLIGEDHIDKIEDCLFDTVDVQFRYLDEWIGIHGFDKNIHSNESLIIKYDPPEPIKICSSNFEKLYVAFSYKGPNFGYFIKENSIKQDTFFEFEFSRPQNLDTIFTKIETIKNFIAFATSRLTFITRLTCTSGEIPSKSKTYTILKTDSHFNENKEFIAPSTMLFSFSDIKNHASETFSAWFNIYERLSPVLELYFQSIYNRHISNTGYFLNLAFALETYDRRCTTDTEFSTDDYSKLSLLLLDALNESQSSSFREWLVGKLRYGNEKTFRKRLTTILSNSSQILSSKIPDSKAFIKKVVDTRNYYVHFDSRLNPIADSDFLQYNIRLKLLLQVCLLQELRFGNEAIEKYLKRTPTYWNAK
jgi:hypothetical protein